MVWLIIIVDSAADSSVDSVTDDNEQIGRQRSMCIPFRLIFVHIGMNALVYANITYPMVSI